MSQKGILFHRLFKGWFPLRKFFSSPEKNTGLHSYLITGITPRKGLPNLVRWTLIYLVWHPGQSPRKEEWYAPILKKRKQLNWSRKDCTQRGPRNPMLIGINLLTVSDRDMLQVMTSPVIPLHWKICEMLLTSIVREIISINNSPSISN